MLVAHVHFTVAESERQKALGALLDEVPAVRAMPGCVAFVPFLDPTRADALGVLHEWESEERFRAYLASPGFAGAGQILRPMMTGAPVSKRFDARLLESVN